MSVTQQVLGRLWRIGQKSHTFWRILYGENTIDGFLLGRSLEKYTLTQAAESKYGEEVTGEFATIAAYEVARLVFGQETNGYATARVPWHLIDHAAMKREGQFYSALGTAILCRNPAALVMTREGVNLDKVARAWKPGMELTDEILSGNADALKDGTTIGNFVGAEEPATTPVKGAASLENEAGSSSSVATPTSTHSSQKSTRRSKKTVTPVEKRSRPDNESDSDDSEFLTPTPKKQKTSGMASRPTRRFEDNTPSPNKDANKPTGKAVRTKI